MQDPSISTEELVLPCHACCVLSFVYAAMDTAFCLVLISRGLAELRILPAAPVDTHPRTPFISSHSALSSYGFSAPLTLRLLSMTSGPGPGELPGFWALWSSAMPPSLGRGQVTTTTSAIALCYSVSKH